MKNKLLFRVMRLLVLFWMVGLMHVSAATYSQTVTLKGKSMELAEVFNTVRKQTGFGVYGFQSMFEGTVPVTVDVKTMPIDQFLTLVLNNQPLEAKVENQTIVIRRRLKGEDSKHTDRFAEEIQQRTVTGWVTDEQGNPLEGVTVRVKGQSTLTMTNDEGRYEISVSASGNTVMYSIVGFLPLELPIAGRSTISVSLKSSVSDLDEVVVVGYGVQKKRDVTGAISSIKTEDMPTNTITSISHALGGRAAGLRVSQTSAQVGGAATFRIRGAASTGAGNEPLIIVDGFPVSASSTLGSGNRYNAGNTDNFLESINPNDIESIEILKDASSTAIYGSRAGHGVIIVTTKRGRSGKVAVSYEGNAAVQKITDGYRMLSATEFMEQRNAFSYETWLKENGKDIYSQYITLPPNHVERPFVPYYTNEDIDQAKKTDWFGAVTQKGRQHQHNISLRGGSEATLYSTSVNYLRQSGVVKNNNLGRFTANINIDQKLSNWTKAGFSLNFSQNNYDNVPLGDLINENAGVLAAASQFTPIVPIYDSDGNFSLNPDRPFIPNPVSLLEITDKTHKDRLLASAFVEIAPTKGLLLRANLGADKKNQKRKNYLPTTTPYGAAVNGHANINQAGSMDYLMDLTAAYTKEAADHSLHALVGYSYQRFDNEGFNAGNQDFLSDGFLYNNLVAGEYIKPLVGSYADKSSLSSYFGRVNYSFKDRYLLTATLRADGASVFNPDNRWGYFPSISIGWRFKDENFMNFLSPILHGGKLRVSYGKTGNSNVGNLTQDFYRVGYTAVFGETGYNGVYRSQLGNPNLTWETTTELNVGLDLSFLNNRISLAVEYFDRTISDLLVTNKPLPSYNEITTIAANIGATQSQGVEITLNTTNIDRNAFRWSTDFVFATFNDTWKNRDPNWKPAAYESSTDPIRSVFSYVSDGLLQPGEIAPVYQQSLLPGQVKLKDLNGDGKLDDGDRVLLGTQDPSFTFGFSNTIQYRRLDLNFHFYGEINRLSGESYYEGLARAISILQGVNTSARFKDRWAHDNQQSTQPNSLTSDFSVGDYFHKKISFVRLRNITLGYRVPVAAKWARQLRLYVDVNNPILLTNWTGLDPETDNGYYAYPNITSFNLGVNITL